MPKLRPPKQPEAPKEPVVTSQEDDLFETPIEEEEVVAAPVVETKKKEEPPKVEENALQKQLDELKKSEALAKEQLVQANRDREAALNRAKERDAEIAKVQKEATQSKADTIAATIAAATAEIAAAKKDIKDAISIGDVDAQTEAMARLSEAQNSLSTAKYGQSALEESTKAAAEKPAPKQETITDPVELTIQQANMPEVGKNWLRAHREYLTDPRKNAKINSLHFDAIEEGHEPYSPAYVEFIETKLGLRQAPKVEAEEEEEEVQPQQRNSIVSAPVSREAPTSSGKLRAGQTTLTPEQRQAAKWAGITEAEYAKQLIRLNEAKANGQIQN